MPVNYNPGSASLRTQLSFPGASIPQEVKSFWVHIEPEASYKRQRRVEPLAVFGNEIKEATGNPLNLTDETVKIDDLYAEVDSWLNLSGDETDEEARSVSNTSQDNWDAQLDRWLFSCDEKLDIVAAEIETCIKNNETNLDLINLSLTSLPPILNQCKFLKNLECSENSLRSLNLNNCRRLEALNCGENYLEHLNLSGCSALKELYCNFNKLTSLNLELCCSVLQVLDCSDNKLTSLNLNDFSSLQVLRCDSNHLTSLNLHGCTRLQKLDCQNNTELRPSGFDLKCLRQMKNLKTLLLGGTGIQWQDLPDEIRNNQEIDIDIRPQHLRNPIADLVQDAHNIHTASVHLQASKTAQMLKANNSDKDLDQAYSEFSQWLQQQESEWTDCYQPMSSSVVSQKEKNYSAKKWIETPGSYQDSVENMLLYTDQRSGVNIKEFLALAWLSVNDPEQRCSSLAKEEARSVLIDALYEIGRGDNLNEDHQPKDDRAVPRSICCSGAFNKIYEKLVSVVKNVDFVLVTQNTLSTILTVTTLKEVRKLCEQDEGIKKCLEDNGNYLTREIWEKVKNSVLESLHKELPEDPEVGGKTLETHWSEFGNEIEYFSFYQ